MDVSSPMSAVVPTLDGPVLRVLAGTTAPLTGRQVHALAGTGSVSGVRLVLNRLVEHGLVLATRAGPADLYVANRNHLAWPAVAMLVGLRTALHSLIRTECARLDHSPVHVSMFGSAARGDGDTASDIDLLVVRANGLTPQDLPIDEDQWAALRQRVFDATGNPCNTFHIDRREFEKTLRSGAQIGREWARDNVHLYGDTYAHLAALATTQVAR